MLIGNLIISMLAALVALLIGFYELPLLQRVNPEFISSSQYKLIWLWVVGYAAFAFITTLAREIIKDSEDIEGDKQYGSVTLPVHFGLLHTKYIIISIVAVILLTIGYLQYIFFSDWLAVAYISLLIYIPLFYLIWLVFKATDKRDYHRASWIMKLVMVSGILFALVVNPELAIF
ncbi:MAG: hypothetical protein COB85_04695 [Bacteroidetes bacterium]|nr:MAG: hypothetical protein COB85_04695 [Bacteroidota bacterium]